MPVYNLELLFSHCIDSILTQTFTDYELIIVDDGSIDISGTISDCYALLSGSIVVIHKVNNGVASARNIGIEFASGKYTCFVDSDDYVRPDFFISLFNVAEKTNSDIVSQNQIVIRDNEEAILRRDPYEVDFKSEKERCDFFVKKVLQGATGSEMWGRLFRNDIIRDNHIRVCESCENYAEDLAFLITYIVCCNKCIHIDYAGYYYLVRNDSMIQKSRDSFKLDALNEVSCYVHDFFEFNQMDYYLKDFALLHFWIMKTEFIKIHEIDRKQIPFETKKIKNYKWYRTNIRKCILYFNRISLVCTKNVAFDYCNLSYYSIHKNYSLFHLIEVIFYKCF